MNLSSDETSSLQSDSSNKHFEIISSEDTFISIHYSSANANSPNTDIKIPIHFSICQSHLSVSEECIYMNDMQVKMPYEKKLIVRNDSAFPTSFSFLPIHNASFICSACAVRDGRVVPLQHPVILSQFASTAVLISIQLLQPGFHEIKLRLQNETFVENFVDIHLFTVIVSAPVYSSWQRVPSGSPIFSSVGPLGTIRRNLPPSSISAGVSSANQIARNCFSSTTRSSTFLSAPPAIGLTRCFLRGSFT